MDRVRRVFRPDAVLWGVVAAGGLLLSLLRPAVTPALLPLLAVFAVLGVAAEGVPSRSLYGLVFPSFSLCFAWFLLDQAGAAVWLAFAAPLVGRTVFRREPPAQGLLAGATAVLGMAAGLGVYRLAGGLGAPLQHWLPLSLFSPTFLLVAAAVARLRGALAGQASGRLFHVAAAHFVLTAFGLLLAVALMLHGTFAFFLAAVALGAVIHLMHLQDELEEANLELRTLQETAGRLTATLRLDGVFAVLAEAVARMLRSRDVALFLFREGPGGQEVAEVRMHGEVPLEQRRLWERLAAAAAARREGLLSRDLVRDPALASLVAAAEVAGSPPRSFLAVPLTADGQLLGVLAVGHPEARRFHPKHLRVLTIIAGQVAAALRNAILYEQAEDMAITDDLTGLRNHRYLSLRLAEALEQARAHGDRLAVVYLDLDRFKECNDRYGHLAGDHLLRQFADVLRQGIRQSDVAARYGGDEFVLILPGAGRAEAAETLRRVREAVGARAFRLPGSNVVVRLGVSAGIAAFPEDGDTVDELLAAADRSMYRDKDGDACARAE